MRIIKTIKIKYYGILFIALVFSSCDVSTLSSSDALSLVKLKVNINIHYDTNKDTINYLRVKLSDGKKQIINKNIIILLNNHPLNLVVKDELYYTKTSYYQADSLVQNDAYYFEIILPDSTKHPIAFVKPMAKTEAATFSIPDSIATNENFVLKWKQLNTPHQLELIKGTETKYKIAKMIIEYGYSVKPIDTLIEKEGEYLIQKSYINDSLASAKHFDIILSRKENGLINPNLLKNSSITYHHIIEKTIQIKSNTPNN